MKRTMAAKEITIIAVFAAVTAVLAQIAVPVPFSPMPISFGLVAVYITGILLKPKHAVLTQTVYLLIGAVGLPVFGGFRGGLSALFGPTGGYLFVYPLMAAVVSTAINSRAVLPGDTGRGGKSVFIRAAVSVCAAHIILYLGGTIWFSATTENTFETALDLAVYPYIPLDIVKIAFCVAVIVPLRSRLMSMNLLMLDRERQSPAENGAGI